MIRGSLRKQLFLVVLIAMVPVFAVHEAIEIVGEIRSASEHAAVNTRVTAAAAVPLLKSALIVGDLSTAQETLDNIMRHGQFQSLRLLDQFGARTVAEGKVGIPDVTRAVPEWFEAWLDFRFAAQEFPVMAGGVNYGTLVAEPSSRFLVADIWAHLWIALIIWLATLAFFIPLLKITLLRGLRPLDDLAMVAHRLGAGDLNCRAPVSDVPELAETARAFNHMADNLAEARDRLEERVRQATRELESLITRIPAGVYKMRMLTDGDIRFDFVSPRWCELLEIDAETVYRDARAAMSRLHPDEVEAFLRLQESVRATLASFRWEGRLRDGLRVRWLRIESTPTVLDNGDILWEGIQYDITATKEREAELDHIAHYDLLTGIPNRMLLADRLHQAIAQAQRTHTALAVCYLDLDGFKPVNDAHGHEAGDALLVEVARRLHATVRGGDTVARIGGDEFVLLLAGMARMDEFETTLNRILEVVNAPIAAGAQVVSVSASIGITLYPEDDADPDLLLCHADQAMYQAKQAGRNKFIFFDPNLEDAARRHRELLQQIENGLDGDEFELHYEPKVNMRLGTVLGFEALIRWRHPVRGLLPPDQFLSLIEDNDLIVVLGEWVIDHALTQLGAWHRQGIEVSVSVNIAPRQLQQGHFAERLRQLLARHADAPPDRLEIEIVETAALSDTARFAELIGECRQLGVTFALDDFGTGYSALTYLKDLPAETLKIDQSFVRDMLSNANDLAIVEGVIGLTEMFRRRVIAEGVESPRHCTLLLNMGCELAQGHGIARPMPAEEVDAWLRTWQPDPAWGAVESSHWPRDDLPLVIAENHHLEWVESLVGHVEGRRADPPEIEATQCRFGQWHAGQGRRRYGRIPEFAAITEVHARVHALGRELIDLAARGQREAALARLPELHALRDELLTRLRQLMAAAANQDRAMATMGTLPPSGA